MQDRILPGGIPGSEMKIDTLAFDVAAGPGPVEEQGLAFRVRDDDPLFKGLTDFFKQEILLGNVQKPEIERIFFDLRKTGL